MEYIYRGVVAEKLNARLTGALVLGCPYGVLIGLEDCEPAVRLELLAVNHANKKRIAQTLHKPYKAFH
jgi:hypothetical protein